MSEQLFVYLKERDKRYEGIKNEKTEKFLEKKLEKSFKKREN